MQIHDVDLNDLETFQRGTPHDQFRILRREDPVHRHPGAPGEQDFWCITKHADLKFISKNPQLFSSERQATLLRDPDESSLAMLRTIMLNMDPPRHRQYRELVNKAFTPRMVQDLERSVRNMVDDIIDAVCEKGECDFVEELAAPLPMRVICEMMGVPEEDRLAIYQLGNQMVGSDDPETNPDGSTIDGDAAEMQNASAQMFLYAEKLKKLYTDHPADNLATRLLQAELNGEKLSDVDFNSFFLILAIAGNETTRTVTSNGMINLIRHPDQRQRLLDEPSLIPTAIEEILRFDPAVHGFRRTATEDVEIRGRQIGENDKIVMWYPAVNRDEDVFKDPDVFDVGRNPNDHLSFGIGEHYCLGANLARMELRQIFTGLLARLPDLELAAEPRRLRSNFVNGVKEMRVTFSPSAPKRI
jgi:cytochrome P450